MKKQGSFAQIGFSRLKFSNTGSLFTSFLWVDCASEMSYSSDRKSDGWQLVSHLVIAMMTRRDH